MQSFISSANRRGFIKTAAMLTTGIAGLSFIPTQLKAHERLPADGLHIIGPIEGFSPQVGTLVSMLNWMRATVLRSVNNLSADELDYLHDAKSNSIGAMLMHLAATEIFYKGNTFEGRGDFTREEKKLWGDAMTLGDSARKSIRGHDLKYYLDILQATRADTLDEFKKRDDKWLMSVDPSFFSSQPTNNYCKWFHVCEHESNHNGQIKWIRSRLPGPVNKDES
jgi:uncharacterized damage-inducible protein DinB